MSKHLSLIFLANFAAAVVYSSPAFSQSGPTEFSLSGGLYYPNGTPITQKSVDFKIDILDPTGNCVLYQELHNDEDLSTTRGGFALQVGAGANGVNNVSGGTVLTSSVFENNGVASVTGCGSVNLASGDNRLIRVSYDLGSGFVAMNPTIPMTSSAYAMVAESVQGKRAADLVQIRNDNSTYYLGQSNIEWIFNSTNWPRMQDLLNGTSSQYMVTSPSADVSFNNRKITNLAAPTANTDAATKQYADGSIGGFGASLTGIGLGSGEGSTLVWDAVDNRWEIGSPNATDNSKLPLAGGTMSGAITMGGNDIANVGQLFNVEQIYNVGHITMRNQSLLRLGSYTSAQEGLLALGTGNAGTMFYNSDLNQLRVWNGTDYSGIAPGGAAGGDLTGSYPSPTIVGDAVTSAKIADGAVTSDDIADGAVTSVDIGNNQITSAKLNNSGIAVNRLLMTDATTGSTVAYAICAQDEILKFNSSTGWGCATAVSLLGNTSVTAGSYGSATSVGTFSVDAQGRLTSASNVAINFPVTSVAGKTGDVSLNTADVSGLGTAATYNAGTNPGEIPALDSSARIPAVDGGLLTNVSAQRLQGRILSSASPSNGQILVWNNTFAQWEPQTSSVASAFVQGGNSYSSVATLGTNDNYRLDFETNNTARLSIDTNGNVGIGTQVPSLPLHIEFDDSTVYSNSAKGNGLRIVNRNTSSGVFSGIAFQANGNFVGVAQGGINLVQEPTLNATGHLAFYTRHNATASEKLRISSNGNIGIGTTSPAARLDVADTSTTTSAVIVPRAPTFTGAAVNGMIRYNTTTQKFEAFEGSWKEMISSASSGADITDVIAGSGLLGGASSGAATLSVQFPMAATSDGTAAAPAYSFSGDTDNGMFKPSTNSLAFSTAGTQRLTIDGSGNVGIGTTNPSAALDARGRVLLGPGGDWEFDSDGHLNWYNLLSLGWPMSQAGGVNYIKTGGGSNHSLQLGSFDDGAVEIRGGTAGASIYTAGTQRLFVSGSTGNVGVGTATPNLGSRDAGATYLTIYDQDQDKGGTLELAGLNTQTGAPVGTLAFTQNGFGSTYASSIFGVREATGNGYIGLQFVAGGQNRMRVTGSGNVGIGTTSPSSRLDVNDTSTTTSAIVVPRAATFTGTAVNGMIRYNTTTQKFEAFEGTWKDMISTASSGADITDVVAGSGLLGGASSGAATLSVQFPMAATSDGTAALPAYAFSSDPDTGMYRSGTNELAFSVQGTQRLRFDSNGKSNFFADVSTENGVLYAQDLVLTTAGDFQQQDANATSYFAGRLTVGANTVTTGARLDVVGTGAAFSSIIIPRDTAANRPTVGVNGMIRYNTTTQRFEAFEGTWKDMISTAAGDADITDVIAGSGLLGGATSGAATLSVQFPMAATSDGTAAAPAYSFSGDADNGMFKSSTNTLAFSTSGTQRLTIDGSGNVGMGTASPQANLHLSGNSLVSGTMFFGATSTTVGTNSSSLSQTALKFNHNSGLSGPFSVGAGVNGSSPANGGNLTVYAQSANGSHAGNVGGSLILQSGAGGSTGGSGSIRFQIGATETMRLDPAGRFGISTTSPTDGTILDINGTGTAFSSVIIPRDTTALRPIVGVNGMIRYNTTTQKFEAFEGSWKDIISTAAAGADITDVVAGSGLLGGASSGAATLSVQFPMAATSNGTAAAPTYSFSGDTDNGMFKPSTNSLAFSTAGTQRLTIDGSGNLGIGTTSPSAKLEINGQIKISGGTPGAGKVLTSDASGLATWADAPGGGSSDVQTFTVTGTWTKPASGTLVFVQCWGAGGGGGRGSVYGGGGGGGGAYVSGTFKISQLPATVAVTVGAGGIGAVNAGDGTAGGSSLFGTYVVAAGGGFGNGTSSNCTSSSNFDAGSGGGVGNIAGGDGVTGSQPGFGFGSFGTGGSGGRGCSGSGTGGNGGGDALGGAAGGSSYGGGGGGGAGGPGGGNGGAGSTGTAAAGEFPAGGGGGSKTGSAGNGGGGQCLVTTI